MKKLVNIDMTWDEIKHALDAGCEVPGAVLVERMNIQIK